MKQQSVVMASKTSISDRLFSGVTAVISGQSKDKAKASKSKHQPVIYLCGLTDASVRRLKIACLVSIDEYDAVINAVETVESLMSEDVFAEDLVIVDRDGTQEFMARHVLSLCDSKPSLIWIDSGMSLSKIADQVKSAFKLNNMEDKK